MIDDTEYPWPEKGDQLFKSDEDWWHNACLSYLHDDWELYTVGYKRAADNLIEQLKERRMGQDSLVFPIVFLYRQYLELRLKRLIENGHQLLDQPYSFPKTHALDTLWTQCRAILQKIEPKPEKQDLEAIDEAIEQFCTVDPTSEGFRYPIGKKGARSLPRDLRYINLRNLAEVMDRVGGFFEAASDMVIVYLQYKREMDEEYREIYGY